MLKTREEQIAKLKAMKDSDIDYSDIPDMGDELLKYVKMLRKQKKKMVSLRMDNEVLDWFKSRGKGYQTEINNVLRSFMAMHSK